jgi:hypothetical protein
MATTERTLPFALDPREVPASAISTATLAAVAAVLLCYVSSSFQLADLFGLKRILQGVLIVPIAAAASYYIVTQSGRLLDPLILFALLRLATEIALRGNLSFVLDSISAVLALTVVTCVPEKSFDYAVGVLINLCGVFAVLAIVQWVLLANDPQLNTYVLGPIDEGEIQDTIRHPIALLGLVLQHEYTIGGITVGRMQSFAKEPSLNVIYFMLPASLALLRNTVASVLWGGVILIYCVLSLSGSVFLTCAFTAFWWLAMRVLSIRVVVPWGILLVMTAYLGALHFSALSFLQLLDVASQYGDFLSKSTSASARGAGAVSNTDEALLTPFGSTASTEVPGPWLVNSALAAGWLAVPILIWFLVRLGRELSDSYARTRPFSAPRLGTALLIGALATVLVFNDYQMGNYVGLVLLSMIYRTLRSRNERHARIESARETCNAATSPKR